MTSGMTTRPVRVAVVDSGVHASHPHVRGVAGGIGFDAEGRMTADFVDRLGHGTAVTAAICEKAPDAEVYAVQVFDRELATTAAALVAAIDWANAHECVLINLSLGTRNPDHRAALAGAIDRARAAGATVVAAGPEPGIDWLPGSLPGVVAVELDWTVPRDQCRVVVTDAHGVRVRASGFPRPIPGVPPARNLKGLSFAVANVTGLLAAAVDQKCAPVDKIVKEWSNS